MGRSTLALFVAVAAVGCSWRAKPPMDVSDVTQVHDFLASPPADEALWRRGCRGCLPRVFHTEGERKEYEDQVKKALVYEETHSYLDSAGEGAYPTYEAILSDPDSNTRAVAAVLRLITDHVAKRSRFRNRFRQLAVSRLMDQDCEVLQYALGLLGKIGGPEEAPLVAAFLRHKNSMVVFAAVKALGKIGGPGEAPLVAACLYHQDQNGIVIRAAAEALIDIGGPKELAVMAEWEARIKELPSEAVKHNPHVQNPQLWEHVQKCCGELKKRLDAKKDPKR